MIGNLFVKDGWRPVGSLASLGSFVAVMLTASLQVSQTGKLFCIAAEQYTVWGPLAARYFAGQGEVNF
jgi:hypothetical protein